MNQAKRIIWVLVCAAFLTLVPRQAIAMNSNEVITVTISFTSIGLGVFCLSQKGWAMGTFQVVLGIVGLGLTMAGLMKGGLLEKAGVANR